MAGTATLGGRTSRRSRAAGATFPPRPQPEGWHRSPPRLGLLSPGCQTLEKEAPRWLWAGRDARGQEEPGWSLESAGSWGGGFERATVSWHGEGPASRMGARQWHCGRRRRAQRDLPASSGLLKGWECREIPLASQQPGQGDAHPS